MASRTRNPDWEEDLELKDDLKLYVQRNLSQSEILDLMKVHYPMYAWSLRTLSRRLQHFGIKFINYVIDVKDVKRAVVKEMDGPGRLLGYRALHKKIRELHGLNVPRNLVYNVMADVNPKGLEERGGVGQPKRARRKTAFTSTVRILMFCLSLHKHVLFQAVSFSPLFHWSSCLYYIRNVVFLLGI